MTDTALDSDGAGDPTVYVPGGTSLIVGWAKSGGDDEPQLLDLALANRHGLITGATGTGKTVTLQVLAEGFSAAGVPVFAADIKGDLSGMAAVGRAADELQERADEIGLASLTHCKFPVTFWDIFGEQGHPVRATVDGIGQLLLSRLLELSEPQEGVLNIAFRWAEDERQKGKTDMVIRTLADLRAVITEVGNRSAELRGTYGNIAPATVGVLQRRLLVLEEQGADHFLGEPALDIMDFLRVTDEGLGAVNILAADKLMDKPQLYATFLLWMLDELFQKLPEVGDLSKPKLVFLFDEAHLLFNGARKPLIDQIERVTRLIRSKGVGVYYITQSPADVPDRVSAQLGNRIQHALRAFTPKEQAAVRSAAQTFRPNPKLDTERVIRELRVGEALVSFLHRGGEPSIVQRTLIRPPMSRVGPLTPEERAAAIAADRLNGDKYTRTLDLAGAEQAIARSHTVRGKVGETFNQIKAAANSLLRPKS